MIKQKTLITITEVKEIVGKTITVIKENGAELKLPVSQAERFGNLVFIPTWPARKIGVDQKGKSPQADVNRLGLRLVNVILNF